MVIWTVAAQRPPALRGEIVDASGHPVEKFYVWLRVPIDPAFE